MTANDEPTVAALRRLAATHAPDDSWQPDATAVLHRGRVLRARRRMSTAGAGALVLALAIAVPATLPGHGPIVPVNSPQPSTVSQRPRSVGTGAAATLAPGLVALNVPNGSTAPSAITDFAGWHVSLAPAPSTTPSTAGLSVTLDEPGASDWTNSVTWRAGDGPSDVTLHADWAGFTMATDTHGVLFGSVPSWLPNPVAVLVSPGGWVGSDGTIRHVAELPTFRAPTPDGRLVYLLGASGDAAARVLGEPSYDVAFIGSDGQVVMPACGQDDLDTCSALYHQPLAGWVSVAAARYGVPAAEAPANPFRAAEGLTQNPENPGSGANILARSLWVGTLDGVQLLVYTGYAGAENTADGKVWVIVNDPATAGTHGWQDTIAGTGALRIIATDGDVLTLVDDHGGTHRFDVGTALWLS